MTFRFDDVLPPSRPASVQRETRRVIPPTRAMRLRASAAVWLALWGLVACRCAQPVARFRSEPQRVRVCFALRVPRNGGAPGTLRLRGGMDTDLRDAPSGAKSAERSRQSSALGKAEKARALDSLKLMAARLHMVRRWLCKNLCTRIDAGYHRA